MKKRGIEFILPDRIFRMYFPTHHAINQKELHYVFQMSRGKLDDILLRNAHDCGADVFERHSVRSVIFEGKRAVGVTYKDLSKRASPLRKSFARWIVNASGSNSVLRRHLNGNVIFDPFVNKKITIYAQYGGDLTVRNTNSELNLKVCIHKNHEDWGWYIPIDKNCISVGLVLERSKVMNSYRSLAEIFFEYIKDIPFLSGFFTNPTLRIIERFRSSPIIPSHARQFFGDGWLLIGDAAGCVDPLFSTGYQTALNTGLKVGRLLNDKFDDDRSINEALKNYYTSLENHFRINSSFFYLVYKWKFDFRNSRSVRYHHQNLSWAGFRYSTRFTWQLLKIMLVSPSSLERWTEEILFGNVTERNALAKLCMTLAENHDALKDTD